MSTITVEAAQRLTMDAEGAAELYGTRAADAADRAFTLARSGAEPLRGERAAVWELLRAANAAHTAAAAAGAAMVAARDAAAAQLAADAAEAAARAAELAAEAVAAAAAPGGAE